MAKLVLKMSTSADAFVGGPNGELDWLLAIEDPAITAWTLAVLRDASLHLMGSRTYHDMTAYWPTSTGPLAPPMNDIPKAVFTRKGLEQPSEKLTTTALKDARAADGGKPVGQPTTAIADSWLRPRVMRENLADEIKRLKQQPGKALLAHGGAGFARSLIKTGLIDEYRLLVHPVVLGRGLPIFSELPRPLNLVLVESTRFPSGAVAQVYRPKAKPDTPGSS
jgi:dihydrofolate reductase